LDDGYAGTTVQAYSNKTSTADGDLPGVTGPRAPKVGAKKQRANAIKLFQYK